MPKAIIRRSADQTPSAGDDPDWRWLTHSSRPNGLLLGPPAATAAVLRQLQPSLRAPVVQWPHDGDPWHTDGALGTLILHDVCALGRDDQQQLLKWLDGCHSHVQVLSRSTCRIYPLVECGVFLEQLYYRLNCVMVDCGLPQSDEGP
jgi:hypothetical protein